MKLSKKYIIRRTDCIPPKYFKEQHYKDGIKKYEWTRDVKEIACLSYEDARKLVISFYLAQMDNVELIEKPFNKPAPEDEDFYLFQVDFTIKRILPEIYIDAPALIKIYHSEVITLELIKKRIKEYVPNMIGEIQRINNFKRL